RPAAELPRSPTWMLPAIVRSDVGPCVRQIFGKRRRPSVLLLKQSYMTKVEPGEVIRPNSVSRRCLDNCYIRCRLAEMDPQMTPKRVAAIRTALGVTQDKLATVLGVSWTSVSRWESGTSAPTGLPVRLLAMLETASHDSIFVRTLRDPRSTDPL